MAAGCDPGKPGQFLLEFQRTKTPTNLVTMFGTVEVRGHSVRYSFLKSDALTPKERQFLVRSVAEMCFDGEEKRDVRMDLLTGSISRGPVANVGSFSGEVFDAELETATGHKALKIMVASVRQLDFDPNLN
jgi:hypothetical protein